MGLFRENGKAIDPKFATYLATADLSDLHERLLVDLPHPTDPNRTFQRDLAERVEALVKRQAADQQDRAERLEHRDVARVLRELDEEYTGDVPDLPNDATEEQLDANEAYWQAHEDAE